MIDKEFGHYHADQRWTESWVIVPFEITERQLKLNKKFSLKEQKALTFEPLRLGNSINNFVFKVRFIIGDGNRWGIISHSIGDFGR